MFEEFRAALLYISYFIHLNLRNRRKSANIYVHLKVAKPLNMKPIRIENR